HPRSAHYLPYLAFLSRPPSTLSSTLSLHDAFRSGHLLSQDQGGDQTHRFGFGNGVGLSLAVLRPPRRSRHRGQRPGDLPPGRPRLRNGSHRSPAAALISRRRAVSRDRAAGPRTALLL